MDGVLRIETAVVHGAPLGVGIAAVRLIGGRDVGLVSMLLSWIAAAVITGRRWHEESVGCRVDGEFEFLRRCADCDVGFVDEVQPAL